MRFSIIVPVYNIADYISTCLDSILEQSFSDWECVCVDDGSTDGSGTVLDRYASHDCRFVVCHQDNGGVGSARNRGLGLAKGEYVWFVDGDDFLTKGALAGLNDILSDCNADGIKFDFLRLTAGGGVNVDAVCEKDIGYDLYSLQGKYAEVAFSRCVGSLLVGNGLFKRERIWNLAFGSLRNGEDLLFGTMAFLSCRSFAITKLQPYVYVDRPGSAVYNALSVRRFSDVVECAGRIAEETKRWRCYSGEVPRLLSKKLTSIAIGWIFMNLQYLEREERRRVEQLVFSRLVDAFADVPMLGWVFAMRSWVAIYALLWIPWRIKVALLRWPQVRALRRGGR